MMPDSGVAVDPDDLEHRSTSELFALYRGILLQLRERGVVRTETPRPAITRSTSLLARLLERSHPTLRRATTCWLATNGYR